MLDLAGIGIDARSVGGLETCIQVPGWGLAFDIGRCPPGAVSRGTVLFTHAHVDHIGGIAHHCATRDLLLMAPPTYVIAPEIAADVGALLDAFRRLDRSDMPCHLVPCGPGETYELKKDLVARPFRSPHRVLCQGYAIWSRRRKLRPEWRGRPGPEIRDARARGDDVSEEIEVPELVFTGDTLIEVVEKEEVVRMAERLIMEVTFFDERVPVAKAREKGHIHLDEVIERAELFSNRAILFTHMSARYGPDEAREIVSRRLPDSLRDRVTLLVPSAGAREG